MRRKIRMSTSLSGEELQLTAGQEYELDEPFAIALVTEPADAPRATPIGWDPPEEAVAAAREKADAEASQAAADRVPPATADGNSNGEVGVADRDELLKLSRDELDARATAEGVDGDVTALPNKGAVADAILAARQTREPAAV